MLQYLPFGTIFFYLGINSSAAINRLFTPHKKLDFF